MSKKSKTLSGSELGNKLLKSVHEMRAGKVAARLELLDEVCKAESQLAKGDGVDHEEAMKKLRSSGSLRE